MPRTAPAPALPSVLTGDTWPATQRGTMTAQPADVEVYPPDHPQLREAWQAGHTAGTIEQADRQAEEWALKQGVNLREPEAEPE